MTAAATRVGVGEKETARSVLLAEHEPEVAEMSARYLRRDGLRVRLVTTPEQALAELTGGPDAAAVLDLTMPGLDPRRIRRALRTPVIFLVAGPQGPRPRGLARGGPVGPRRWLARPFGPRQLVAMVRDVLAEPAPWPAAGAESAERAAGGLRLDGPGRGAVADGQPVKLTATEFAILAALLGPSGTRPVPPPAARRRGPPGGRGTGRGRVYRPAPGQARGGQKSGVIRTARGAGYAVDP